MATKKFAGPSPYTFKPSYPKDDYLHTEFLENVKLKPKTKAPPVVVALFGLGRAGTIHLGTLANNPRVILKYVVEDRTDKFAEMKIYWKFGDEVTFLHSKDSDRVYNDKTVNVIFVTSPTHTHYDIVVKALANNKDVFCEKPIAQTIEDTKKCYETAKAKGRILYCGFNRRFDPAYSSVKERVMKGEVGHVQILRVTSKDSLLPPISYLKMSGGVFHDCTIHDFDLICWMLGELPTRIQVSASALVPEIKDISDFDTIGYMLTFPSGAIALGDNSRSCVYGHDQRAEVFGNKGMIKVENERPCHASEIYVGNDSVKLTPIAYAFPSRYKLAYQREVEHFLDVVQDGVPQSVTSWQTLAVSKIATAATQSARTGQAVYIDWSKDDIPKQYA